MTTLFQISLTLAIMILGFSLLYWVANDREESNYFVWLKKTFKEKVSKLGEREHLDGVTSSYDLPSGKSMERKSVVRTPNRETRDLSSLQRQEEIDTLNNLYNS